MLFRSSVRRSSELRARCIGASTIKSFSRWLCGRASLLCGDMLPDARPTLAHSSFARFCISLQYSSERFSESAVTTDWIRSLADEMSRLGDSSWSEANLVIRKMFSNKMRRKTNF